MKHLLGFLTTLVLFGMLGCSSATEVNGGIGAFNGGDDSRFSRIVVGGYNLGIFYSDDTGRTWQMATDNPGPRTYDIASGGNYIYAIAYMSGGYRSADNGTTWELMNGLFDSAAYSVYASGSLVLIGTTSNGILRSTDAGDSWSLATSLATGVVGFTHIGSTIFAASGSQGIARSTDDGATWQMLSRDFNGIAINAVATDGRTLYGSSSGQGIFRSDNLGDSWQHLNNSSPVSYGLAWSNGVLYGGTTNGLARSLDSGMTWQSVPEIPSLVYRLKVVGNYVLAPTYTAGMFLSNDRGTTWQQRNNGLTDSAILAIGVR